ncbi:HAD family hydrolase [Thermococcus sp.]|uniref:HAD family hydrolase n=1 Tax=Thermococcus sp. TaxID=35749 RepID=UPI002602D77A|nr:HAD family hydrolase [Thermococcus sp.]
MLKGLIFDVDETLVYYEGYTLRRWYDNVATPVMKKLGVFVDWDTFKKIIEGKLSRKYVEKFGIDHVEFWKALDRANRTYRENLLKAGKIKPFPDVDALKELRNMGLKLAAVSNASQDNTELVLRAFGLDKYFDIILGKDYTYLDGVKPNPYLVNKALRLMKLRPDEVLLVGDSIRDILAGKRAGVKTVNIVRFEKVPGADYYVNDLWELVKIVRGLTCPR